MIAFLCGVAFGSVGVSVLAACVAGGRKRSTRPEPMLVDEFKTTIKPNSRFLIRGSLVSVPSGVYTRAQLDDAVKAALALSARVTV